MGFESCDGPFFVVCQRGHRWMVLGGPYLTVEVAAEAGEAMPMERLRMVREVGRFR